MALRTIRTATSRRGRRATAAAAAGALALLLTACGGQGTSGGGAAEGSGQGVQRQTPVQLVSAAAKNTADKSAAISIDVKTSAAGISIPVTGEGKMDAAKGLLDMEISTQIPGMGAMKLRQLMVDGAVYMTGFPGMKKDTWATISADELGALGGAGGTTDPADQLQMFTKAGDNVKAAGTAQVNGVTTTKYTGTIDLKKLAAAAGAEAPDVQDEQLAKQYEALGLSAIPFEFYVDDEGLPARMVTTIKGAAQGQQISAVSTVDFTDWGIPVEVTAPTKTVPFKELMGGALGGQQG